MDEEVLNKQKFNFTEFLKKNFSKIVGLIISIIVLIILLIGYDEYKKRQNIVISVNFNKAKILIENNKPQEALTLLEDIVLKKNSFYSPSALNLIVDNNLIENKEKVLSYYDEIIINGNLDTETKNLLIFKKTIFIGDEINENELLTNLKPLIQSNSLWKNTILDYIKKFYLASGQPIKAKEFENSINK